MNNRPFSFDGIHQLREAHSRADEIEAAWRAANFRRPARPGRPGRPGGHRSALRLLRQAAGRRLVGLGQWVMPAGAEPCA